MGPALGAGMMSDEAKLALDMFDWNLPTVYNEQQKKTKPWPAAAPASINLTDAAAERVKSLIAKSDEAGRRPAHRREEPGCSGLSYFVEYAEAKKPFEEVVEDKGVTILIDPAATMFLIGSEMDYVEDKLQSGFIFTNPNEKGRCGCGEILPRLTRYSRRTTHREAAALALLEQR